MVEYVIYADVPERNQHVRDFISRSGGEYLGCVDRNPAKWDSDKKMYAPAFIAKHPRAKIVITSFDIERIAQYIRQQGWMNESREVGARRIESGCCRFMTKGIPAIWPISRNLFGRGLKSLRRFVCRMYGITFRTSVILWMML